MCQGIVRALREYQQKLIEGKVSIFVRRAGPNYQEGLRVMRELGEFFRFLQILYHHFILRHSLRFLHATISGETLGVPINVFGPETHMTAIVGMALGRKKVPQPAKRQLTTANFLLPDGQVCNNFDHYINFPPPGV